MFLAGIFYKTKAMKSTKLLLILIISVIGCHPRESGKPDISGIDIDSVEIKRYGRALFSIPEDSLKQGLEKIAPEFRLFLGNDYDDPLNIIKIRDYVSDPKLIELYKATRDKFDGLDESEAELTKAFRYIKYYYPGFNVPEVYSYISGLQYEQPVMYADSALIIGLDLYLGEDFKPYKEVGLPMYKTKQMKAPYIPADCVREIAMGKIPVSQSRSLLDEMIRNAKLIYFTASMLPDMHDSLVSGYTGQELNWLRDNEKNIWAFLIENELLFSPDYLDIRKFTTDGPFTPGFGDQSAAGIGNWIGWQILKKFRQNNPEIELSDLMLLTDSQEILKRSAYKPAK